MHIIPVIDLKDGVAVMAGQAERRAYRPLATPLCPQPDILAVTAAYLSVFPFRTFYVADLDAIENRGNNHAAITRMLEAYTGIRLWVDAGLDMFVKENAAPFRERVSNVLGSETGIAIEQLRHYTRVPDWILSLDFDDRGLLGDRNLPQRPALLPQRIIIMSLGRVGSNTGPDLERLSAMTDTLRGRQVYAAGGVRNAEDLYELAARKVHGALLATSLHNKTITSRQLNRIARRQAEKPRKAPAG